MSAKMLKGNQVRTLTFELGQFGSRSCNTNARKLAAPIARATGVYRNGIALVIAGWHYGISFSQSLLFSLAWVRYDAGRHASLWKCVGRLLCSEGIPSLVARSPPLAIDCSPWSQDDFLFVYQSTNIVFCIQISPRWRPVL